MDFCYHAVLNLVRRLDKIIVLLLYILLHLCVFGQVLGVFFKAIAFKLGGLLWTDFLDKIGIILIHFDPRMRFQKLMDRLTLLVIPLKAAQDEVFALF